MKVYVSADIEGVTGTTTWDETERKESSYSNMSLQMTKEVNACCIALNKIGADEIIIKDAHDSGRNIDHNYLPKNTKLIRSWSGSIFSMVEGLDESFDAILFIGYHSPASSSSNPLSHTMSLKVSKITINEQIASEFLIHAYIAEFFKVPIAFLSGDKGLCDEVNKYNSNIATVAVKEGIGNSTINIHPELALELIEENVKKVFRKPLINNSKELPKYFTVDVEYYNHCDAYRYSMYKGVSKINEKLIRFESDDYIEVLRFINFCL